MPWCSSTLMPRRKEGTRASTRSRRVSFLEGSRHQEVEDGTQVGVLGASNLGVVEQRAGDFDVHFQLGRRPTLRSRATTLRGVDFPNELSESRGASFGLFDEDYLPDIRDRHQAGIRDIPLAYRASSVPPYSSSTAMINVGALIRASNSGEVPGWPNTARIIGAASGTSIAMNRCRHSSRSSS